MIATLANCVGDQPPNTTSTSDAGSGQDSPTATQDGTAPIDANSTDAGDAAPTCVVPNPALSGTLDTGFSNGVKKVGTTGFYVHSATVDPQGTVFALGSVNNCVSGSSGYDFGILHIFEDGSLDPAFAVGDHPLCLDFSPEDFAYSSTLLPSGVPIFAGGSGNGATNGFGAIASITADAGGFNDSFNLNGQLLLPTTASVLDSGGGCPIPGTDFSTALTTINAIAASSTKIVLAGMNSVSVCTPNTNEPQGSAGFIYMLNKDGTADSSFNGGQPLMDATLNGFWGVTFDAAGNVYAIGQTLSTASVEQAAVRKFTSAGVPAGMINLSATGGFLGRSIVALADGNVIVGGPSNLDGDLAFQGNYAGALSVLRLTGALAIDSTFASGAPLVLPLRTDGYEQYTSLAVLCDGTVLAAGTGLGDASTASDYQDIALVKVTSAGKIDTTFGIGGIAYDHITGNEVSVAAGQDPTTGKVIVVGRDTTPSLVLARFNP